MSRVKICGLSRKEDIDAVNRVLPDYIGFVFAESRRRVDADTAAKLKARLDDRIKVVGVFVNQGVEYIAELHRKGIIDLAQLHGDEDDVYIRRLREECGCEIIKAVGVGKALPVSLPENPDYLLFDAASVVRGGSGKTFDWNILQGYKGLPYFLAGGLTLANVGEAVNLLEPFGVDVSSGVETDGLKDREKIDRFVRLVKGYI